MRLPKKLKDLAYPPRGHLRRLRFRERDWLTALVPDDETFGLSREMILQRVYDAAGGFPSGTVIDAGAHVGLFSLLASQHARHVVSVEPDPVNFRVLEINKQLNRLDNITPVNAALWSEDTELSFSTSWHTTGGAVGADGDLRVRAVSLDGLIEEHGDIDLLKIDIEGAETEVLPKSRQLARVRRIIGELHLHHEGEERPMVEALEAQGFRVRLISASSLYEPRWVRQVLRNWRALDGNLRIKLGLIAFLLAPVQKPRRPPGSRDMPLLVAER